MKRERLKTSKYAQYGRVARVGELSSKYAYKGSDLDADVSKIKAKINTFEEELAGLIRNSDLSTEQMRASIVSVLENNGFMR